MIFNQRDSAWVMVIGIAMMSWSIFKLDNLFYFLGIVFLLRGLLEFIIISREGANENV